MPTNIDERVLQGIFNASQQDHVTTQAVIWHLAQGEMVPRPTLFVAGDVTLTLGGQTRNFPEGAYVFEHNGRLEAMKSLSALDGGLTVDGGPARPTSVNPITNYTEGNIATLQYSDGKTPGTGQLMLRMPENRGAGWAIRYPAADAEDVVKLAQGKNSIVQLKQPDGTTIEGFFPKNSGGVMPKSFGPYAFGTKYDQGDFVQVTRQTNGDLSLSTWHKYTAEEMNRVTSGGHYREPSNNLDRLQTLDGKPVNASKYAQLDTQPALKDGPARVDGQVRSGESVSKVPDGQQARVETNPPPQLKVEIAGGTPPAEPAEAGANIGALGRLAKVAAPVVLAVTPTIDGITGGIDGYNSSGAVGAIDGAGIGIGKGIIDTYLPGARTGWSDVFGAGDRTLVDRILNCANDLTASSTANLSTALVLETAGVITIPATVPTAFAAAVSGIANVGVNVVKGTLKATDLAGKDQDGGYIYDGVKGLIYETDHLMGWDQDHGSSVGGKKDSTTQTDNIRQANSAGDAEHLLRMSTGSAVGPGMQNIERPVVLPG